MHKNAFDINTQTFILPSLVQWYEIEFNPNPISFSHAFCFKHFNQNLLLLISYACIISCIIVSTVDCIYNMYQFSLLYKVFDTFFI